MNCFMSNTLFVPTSSQPQYELDSFYVYTLFIHMLVAIVSRRRLCRLVVAAVICRCLRLSSSSARCLFVSFFVYVVVVAVAPFGCCVPFHLSVGIAQVIPRSMINKYLLCIFKE